MLAPAIASPSRSRLARGVVAAVGAPLPKTPCCRARALSTTARTRLLHGGAGAVATPVRPSAQRYAFHLTAPANMPRPRTFVTSSVLLRADGSSDGDPPSTPPLPESGAAAKDKASQDDKASKTPSPAALLAAKRKPRSAGAKHSLRRVAVIAQQQPGPVSPSASPKRDGRDATRPLRKTEEEEMAARAGEGAAGASRSATRGWRSRRAAHEAAEDAAAVAEDERDAEDGRHVISAVCLAESFDMVRVMGILRGQGFALDPDGSGFESHEVVHARKWWTSSSSSAGGGGSSSTSGASPNADDWREVDLFVFESGTLVGWGLPADAVDALATSHLVAAAIEPFVALRETETLDFRRDATRETSAMRGDVVVLGTCNEATEGDRLATTRAQIAFSSGLARSTKLAVLERSFTDYFESTRRIPEILAGRKTADGGGGLGHLSQTFILQKTGELLSLRAQLNHYRELTDALPDIFWDARAELGLEGYYEQVGRALDVGVRIKTLNQKMDYAQEIATVLREISSERHGTRLEWIIIVLIAVEVVFELRRVYLDWQEGKTEKDRSKRE